MHHNWITHAEQYLRTAQVIMKELVASENKWIVISDNPVGPKGYIEATKWSDFKVLVPSIFLLLHGIELLNKGLLIYHGSDFSFNHKSDELIGVLADKCEMDDEYVTIMSKFVGKNPTNKLIKEFLANNKMYSADNLHIDIRYPSLKNGIVSDFSNMRYKQKSIISDVNEIINDIDRFFQLSLDRIRR